MSRHKIALNSSGAHRARRVTQLVPCVSFSLNIYRGGGPTQVIVTGMPDSMEQGLRAVKEAKTSAKAAKEALDASEAQRRWVSIRSLERTSGRPLLCKGFVCPNLANRFE